jgi:GrpB-like predicted nucleotidyltransferase (UPF0157 family)
VTIGLGPVARLTEYDPRWPALFEEERQRILNATAAWVDRIEHVGSTAIRGMAAKPIIDILIGLRSIDDARKCIPRLEAIGYEYVPEHERQIPERRYFRKGPVESRTHHIHMVESSSAFFREHLLFRDYLRAHPKDAKQYEGLKRVLAARHENDREAYTKSKTEFIESIVRTASDIDD